VVEVGEQARQRGCAIRSFGQFLGFLSGGGGLRQKAGMARFVQRLQLFLHGHQLFQPFAPAGHRLISRP
jgi:hypothetical protein